MKIERFKFTGPIEHLSKISTKDTEGLRNEGEIRTIVEQNIAELADLQAKLYAEGKYGLLIVFQALDAAGKDSAIKHVMSGVNPQGVDVFSFKQPSAEELSHDYLWRAAKVLPARGKIAIFNRSYYEDVLVVKVHKLYEKQNLPDCVKAKDIIKRRYEQICHFENYLWENGIVTAKFFLHLSKEEQRKRFMKRIDQKEKNWKFSDADIRERAYWDDYQDAYHAAISATATKRNPWYVIPADKKWYSRAVISETLLGVLKEIDPKYPTVSAEQEAELAECKRKLKEEK